MNRCAQTPRVQDYLDGLLEPVAARSFESHAADCPACRLELALYREVFGALNRAPTWDPGPALTERVLDHVLPSRLRRHRRMVALGWGYAAAVAVSLGGIAAFSAQPFGRAALAGLSGEASHRVLQTVTFVLDSMTWLALRAADLGHLQALAGQRLAPVTRAIGTLVSEPALALTLTAAAAASIAVLWWMRPREGAKEVRYVGVLGF